MFVLYIYLTSILYVLLNYAPEIEYHTEHSVLFTSSPLVKCTYVRIVNDVSVYTILAPSSALNARNLMNNRIIFNTVKFDLFTKL
jgi:hypothetical protein